MPERLSRWLAAPAFTTAAGGRIIAWNDAVTQLLGLDERQALGEPCWRVVGGVSVEGAPLCSPACPLIAADVATVGGCTMRVESARRRAVTLHARVLPVVSPRTGRRARLHVLEPVQAARESLQYVPSVTGLLTRREREVLRLLCAGRRAHEVARQLRIAYATARNHVQAILRKLQVHSTLEAVAKAQAKGLLDPQSS